MQDHRQRARERPWHAWHTRAHTRRAPLSTATRQSGPRAPGAEGTAHARTTGKGRRAGPQHDRRPDAPGRGRPVPRQPARRNPDRAGEERDSRGDPSAGPGAASAFPRSERAFCYVEATLGLEDHAGTSSRPCPNLQARLAAPATRSPAPRNEAPGARPRWRSHPALASRVRGTSGWPSHRGALVSSSSLGS